MMQRMAEQRTLALALLAALLGLLAACQPSGSTATVGAAQGRRSLITLPLPTPGAEVTPGPIVAIVMPPTPTPPPTLAAGAADAETLVQRGEAIYAEHCASCHQPDGQGQDDYPALAGSALVTADEPTAVIETVLHGRGEMPAFEDTLANQEIAAVVSYIRNSWGNHADAVTVEQVRTVTNRDK